MNIFICALTQVSVANGSLEFSAGFIRYLRSETVLRSETDFSWLLVIIGCVLLLAVAMMLVCVMTMVWLTCVMRRRYAISNSFGSQLRGGVCTCDAVWWA